MVFKCARCGYTNMDKDGLWHILFVTLMGGLHPYLKLAPYESEDLFCAEFDGTGDIIGLCPDCYLNEEVE